MSELKSWLSIPDDSDFSIYNLPFGIFSVEGKHKRAGIAIGEYIVDLASMARRDSLLVEPEYFEQEYLNSFIELGKETTNKVRLGIQNMLTKDSILKENQHLLIPMKDCTMHMPVRVGDYTDFYSSIEHATNVGKMFRDPDNALLPNWRHIPVGYHGRSSSIVVSGTDIKRPKGQVLPKDAENPVFQATSRLDFELEMGFIVGKNTELGETVPVDKAQDYIFGFVLFNDWSARDIQKWEYVPLGPFLGKNFGSSISPWIVTTEALEFCKVQGPVQEPKPLPYLESKDACNYDIDLQVAIQPKDDKEYLVSNSNFKFMYWNVAQQLAHHTVNGCNINVGDIMASGTISGKDESSYGSMLELAWAGTKPIILGENKRVFINDNDTVTMRGFAKKDGKRVGFGEVKTKILPAD